MNSKQEWQEGPPKLKRVGPTTCGYCSATFPSTDALYAHKLKESDDENAPGREVVHIWCKICDRDFHTLGGLGEHLRQLHRHKQDFPCPSCALKFESLSAFIKHVELGRCCKLDMETLRARFAAKFKFARGLAKLDLASKQELPFIKKKDFSTYLGYDADPPAPWQECPSMLSEWEVANPNAWASSEPVPSRDSAFPRMTHHGYLRGSTKAPDILDGDRSNPLDGKYEEKDWARDKNLFPDSRHVQGPTSEQLEGLKASQQASVEPARDRGAASFDPNSPYFDPQQCWHDILQMYKCPYKAKCGKSFSSKVALAQHLRSATHNGGKFGCPACNDHFDSLFALAAHVESPSRRCDINREFSEHDMYRIFLDQLTLGMIELGGISRDCTQKFKFQDEFLALYGPQKTTNPTFGHTQKHGINGAGNSGPTGRPGLTEAALRKHHQQIRKEGPWFTPPGEQDDSRHVGSGPELALTADALSRLQLQEKRASPSGQRSGMNRQQQQQPDSRGQPPVPQQEKGSWVRQQLEALGWDTWNQGPVFREQDKECRVNAEPSESSWWPQPKGGGSSGSRR